MDLPDTPIETKIRASFVVIAVIGWYVTTQFTDNTVLQLTVLLGVGIVLPHLAVALFHRRQEGSGR